MDKIKGLWGKYKIPAIIVAILLITAVIGVIIYFSVKPAPPPIENNFIPTGTQESSEPPEPVSEFVVPDIPSAPPSSAPASSASSSSVASKEPDIKVTGNTSSKAAPKPTSSKPSKVEGNASSKPASPPAPPASSSEQTPPPSSSELPPTSSELISEDGHTHGETMINDDGSTWYYHIGMGSFVDLETWGTWKNYPQAKDILRDDGYYETDTSFLWEGAECWSYHYDSKAYWCKKESCWLVESSWENGYHKLVHPDYKK